MSSTRIRGDIMEYIDVYADNHLINRDRRLGLSDSEWTKTFRCENLRPLIVCRGPIRKETMDVCEEMGIAGYGILLSEKDSIIYPNALSPELRQLTDNSRVHRVPDYTGATREEREARIRQIIGIALDNGYDSIFAGYGFMAEDEDFTAAVEKAGLLFIGPCSAVQHAAGKKDNAKKTAKINYVSVTPGVDNVATRTLLGKLKTRGQLISLAEAEGFAIEPRLMEDPKVPLVELADAILDASYAAGMDLFSIDDLCRQVEAECISLFEAHPGTRIRLKAIGGGGGRGQRILGTSLLTSKKPSAEKIRQAAEEAPALVREILTEVKAAGVGDNKNVLIELNIEQTRHNEIQLLGNGDWCIALGGRDCSIQMYEQKLLETSVTREAMSEEVSAARAAGLEPRAAALESDLVILEKMEDEAERFGTAVGLDSASTFECILDGDRHYFMEVNTRIQVEHRVTELVYSLRFTNPSDKEDCFVVESLVEAMILVAAHGDRLPRPERIPRFVAAVEARLNATDANLSPSAGGYIHHWSDPIPGEIRDDQGICRPNPDTGHFMRHHLTGAYDSNIALLLTRGSDRESSYRHLAEVLKSTVLHGRDLVTNREFQYGLVNWFLHNSVLARPTTRFVGPYLTLVGMLKQEADKIDLLHAYSMLRKQCMDMYSDSPRILESVLEVINRKRTLLMRPMERLLADPHLLSGWLSLNRKSFRMKNGRVEWLRNPLKVLQETYEYLHMSWREEAPATEVIWTHDRDILDNALAFYGELYERFGLDESEFRKLNEIIDCEESPGDFDTEEWTRIRASHAGFSIGNELTGLLYLIADRTDFYSLKVEDDLLIHIPDFLFNAELQTSMKKVLVPPQATKEDEIVSPGGGMYYAQEAPGMDPFIREGDHFRKGQPLFILEVMKMFNKVPAPFSGTVEKILIEGDDGRIVKKGQPLFKIIPDERLVAEDPGEKSRQRRKTTEEFLDAVV